MSVNPVAVTVLLVPTFLLAKFAEPPETPTTSAPITPVRERPVISVSTITTVMRIHISGERNGKRFGRVIRLSLWLMYRRECSCRNHCRLSHKYWQHLQVYYFQHFYRRKPPRTRDSIWSPLILSSVGFTVASVFAS